MAGYDYNYRLGYSNGKGGGSHTSGWNKTSYTDGECSTIIVDADGTRRTIIGCDPFEKPGTYVTKRVLSPAKEYGYADDWPRPSSPVKGYGYAADDHKLHRLSSPGKGYGYAAADHKLHRPKTVYSDEKRGVPHTNHKRRILDPNGTQRTVIPQIFRDDEYRKVIVDPDGGRRTVIPQIFKDDEYRKVIVDPDGGRRTVIGHTFREVDYWNKSIFKKNGM